MMPMPKKDWRIRYVSDLEKIAYNLGDHNAYWVEQALEWAQRIANGERWEAVCNDFDNARCFRLVIWKNGHHRFVGGSYNRRKAASDVSSIEYYGYSRPEYAVPLVVLYE